VYTNQKRVSHKGLTTLEAKNREEKISKNNKAYIPSENAIYWIKHPSEIIY